MNLSKHTKGVKKASSKKEKKYLKNKLGPLIGILKTIIFLQT